MDAVIIGQEKPYISAMISVDSGNVGKWAESRQLAYTTFADLSQKKEVYDLIAKEVAKTNKTLPRVAKVKKFVLLYKELDADDEELTRTRKVRRKFVLQRYGELVEALYGDKEQLDIEADIRYKDGTGYRMKTRVMIKPVNYQASD
jgi:long-chain acyl-CoA synthetase